MPEIINSDIIPKTELMMKLFQLDTNQKKLSNTIEFYDSVPRFIWGNQKVKSDPNRHLGHLCRLFRFKKNYYHAETIPASIMDGDDDCISGDVHTYFPTAREELVEKAIIKLIADGRGCFESDDLAHGKFQLNLLRDELCRHGHTYSGKQLAESIKICNRCETIVRDARTKRIVMTSRMLEGVHMRERFNVVGRRGGRTDTYFIVNKCVSDQIARGNYLLYDYDKHMRIKEPLGRWLHMRMIHYFKYAEDGRTYRINASTIAEESCLPRYHDFRWQIRYIDKAIESIGPKHENIIESCTKKLHKDGNRIHDVTYSLKGSWIFNRHQKNYISNRNLIRMKLA